MAMTHADPPRVRHGQALVPGRAQSRARPHQRRALRDHGPAPAADAQAPGRDIPAERELREVQDGRERGRGHEALQRVQDDEVRGDPIDVDSFELGC